MPSHAVAKAPREMFEVKQSVIVMISLTSTEFGIPMELSVTVRSSPESPYVAS